MNYTYIVQCADGTLYTGWTNCLARRMKAHNEGKSGAKYTQAKRPVKLVYYEGFATREEAMSREYRIKQLTREKKLELMRVLNFDKHFDISKGFKCVEHYAAELKEIRICMFC